MTLKKEMALVLMQISSGILLPNINKVSINKVNINKVNRKKIW